MAKRAAAEKALVVVESPTKVKTIKKYLGPQYVVKASLGHVRDLPPSKLGVDVEKNFKPQYVILRSKSKVLQELKKAAEKVDRVYVATDPDREGEAIGWHLAQELPVKKDQVYRVLFNEITGKAIKAAFASPGRIDLKKVDAQQARRVLDRLVGYKLSPLLWQKVQRGLSAGRVQSVAVRLVAEREREIKAFVPEEYWSLTARLAASAPPEFLALLREKDGEKVSLAAESDVQAVIRDLASVPFVVKAVTKGERRRNPAPPFITSTLQQEAGRKLRFSAAKTMVVAQQLYEGIEIGDEGPTGLITYMRTDSPRVAAEAQAEARELIAARFGVEHLPAEPPVYRARKSAQEAHECIRPASPSRLPNAVASALTRDQLALYRLIWERFMASQMLPALYDTVSVDVGAGLYLFRAQGSTLRFPGFMAIYVEAQEEAATPGEEAEETIPETTVGERLACRGLDPKQHFTQPPPRYSEASLVKELEERGIGRPSTYAQILTTIQQRGYVKREKGVLFPSELGLLVTDLLVASFPEVMEVEFTAQMEEFLDEIEDGDRKWVETVKEFYDRFARSLKRAQKEMDDLKEGKPTDQTCPECGSPLIERWGRFGRFLACTGYPECKYSRNLDNGQGREVVETDEVCDQCGKKMVIKDGRYGKFLACQGYPECKNTKPLTIGIPCPEDGGGLVERRSKRGKTYFTCANYPNCKFLLWYRPVAEPCPKCGAPFLVQKGGGRGRGPVLACWREGCHYRKPAEGAGIG